MEGQNGVLAQHVPGVTPDFLPSQGYALALFPSDHTPTKPALEACTLPPGMATGQASPQNGGKKLNENTAG